MILFQYNCIPRNHMKQSPKPLSFESVLFIDWCKQAFFYPLTFTIWFGKICVNIFYQLFQIYPHRSHHISNLGVSAYLSLSLSLVLSRSLSSTPYLTPKSVRNAYEPISKIQTCVIRTITTIFSKSPSCPLWTIFTTS